MLDDIFDSLPRNLFYSMRDLVNDQLLASLVQLFTVYYIILFLVDHLRIDTFIFK